MYPRAIVALLVCAWWGCSGAEPSGKEPAAAAAAVEPASPGGAEAVPEGATPPAPSPGAAPTPAAAPASGSVDEQPAAPDTAPANASPDAGAPDASAPDAGAPLRKAPPEAEEPLRASVETSVWLPGDKELRVAAQADDEQSVVWAQTSPAGPVLVLRKTSGAVDAIAAAFDDETLWVGWRSHVPGRKSMAALAGFDRDLRLTHPPRILRTFDYDGSPMLEIMLMESRPGTGAGVTVATLVGVAPCRGLHPEAEQGPADCQRLQVDVVDPDGTTVRSAFRLLDGGDGGLTGLLDVGQGVVTSFYVWHGGPLVDVALVPYAASEPVRALDSCGYPPVQVEWVDGALIMACPDPSGSGESCSGRASAACGTLRRMTLEGNPLPPDVGHEVRFHRVTETCAGSEPVMRVEWVEDDAQPEIVPGHLDLPPRTLWMWSKPGPGPKCPGSGRKK